MVIAVFVAIILGLLCLIAPGKDFPPNLYRKAMRLTRNML